MQYAEVALPVKTVNRQELFTYRVPPALLADLSIGQRVIVPFRRQKMVGVLMDWRKAPPKIRGSIKEISELAELFPLFDKNALRLAYEVARTYGATIGQVLEIASPKLAKRMAKNVEYKTKQGKQTSTPAKIYGLYKQRTRRLNDYVQLIIKAKKAGKTSQVLFVTQEFAQEFSEFLVKKGIENTLIPPVSDMTNHYKSWINARVGESDVVVGTRKSIFLPLINLGLIIVDEPSEYGYKEEQFPYYHAASVAKIKSEAYQANLILGDSSPRLEDWYDAKKGMVSLLASSAEEKISLTVIDSTASRRLINESIVEHIHNSVNDGGKVAVYFNRKGTARIYRCIDCETAFYCPNCDTILNVFEENGKTVLRCSSCNYETQVPYRCPVCQSYSLGSAGFGINTIVKVLKEYLPEVTIQALSKENVETEDANVLVATSELLYLHMKARFDIIVVLDIDSVIYSARYSAIEEAYLLLTHLAQRSRHLVVQTREPQHLIIQSLAKNNVDELYTNELKNRRQYSYPPAEPIIQLSGTGNDEQKLKEEAQKLSGILQAKLPQGTKAVSEPTPIGSGKRRGTYRYQIIIRSPLTRLILDTVPSNWRIDPEPQVLG